MSQRQPGKNRPGGKKSRKNRNQKRPAQTSQQQPKQQQPTQAADAGPAAQEASASDKPSARRAGSRRNERRAEAQKKAKQKKQLQMIGGAVAVAVVVAILLVLVNRPGNSGIDSDYSGLAFAPPPVTAAGAATPEGTAAPDPQNPMTGAVLGDPNAPVTMVVYADFECPYCRIFASDTQQQVIDDFVRDGQVKLEFREFPVLGGQDLTDDNNTSAQTAEAVMCAAEQDAYLDYHDKLYANQGAFSNDRLKQYADELDLDTDAFGECLDSGKYEPAIQQMKAEGQALGITATPMFLINGSPTQMTDQGYDLLKKQLEAAIQTAE